MPALQKPNGQSFPAYGIIIVTFILPKPYTFTLPAPAFEFSSAASLELTLACVLIYLVKKVFIWKHTQQMFLPRRLLLPLSFFIKYILEYMYYDIPSEIIQQRTGKELLHCFSGKVHVSFKYYLYIVLLYQTAHSKRQQQGPLPTIVSAFLHINNTALQPDPVHVFNIWS